MRVLIFSDGMWLNVYIYLSMLLLKIWSSALVAPRCPWAVSPLAGWRWPSLVPPQTQNDYRFWEAWFLAVSTLTPTNPSAQAILAKPFVLTGLRPPLVEGVGAGAVGKHMSKMVEKIWGKWFKDLNHPKACILGMFTIHTTVFQIFLVKSTGRKLFGLWNDPIMNLMTILHGNSTYFGPQDN